MKRSRVRRQYATIVILTLVCLAIGRGVWGMWGTFTRASREAQRTEQELQKITEHAGTTERAVADLHDPLEREAVLRARFDVGKPGEKLLIVVDDTPSAPEETQNITWLDRIGATIRSWLQ